MVMLCLMLGTFPLWYWFCTWAMPDMDAAFALTGGSLLLSAIVWLHRRCGFPLERRSLLLAGLLARIAAVGMGVGVFFLMQLFFTKAAAIGAGILVWLFYLMAWELLRLPTEKLLSVHAFILLCVTYFIGLVLCRLQNRMPFGDVNYLMLGLHVALFGFLRNRMMLLKAIAGRQLPKGFHRHNLGLMACFLLPGAVLFLCRKQVTAFIGTLLKITWTFLLKVWRLMAAQFYRKETLTPTETGGTAIPRQGNAWLGTVISLLIVGAALSLIIRFRSELWDFLRMIVSGMYRLVRKIILARAPEPYPDTHSEYTDSVELLETLPARSVRRKDSTWRQFYRTYKHTADPAEKFRAGYAFWMKALKHWHADVPPNAVPRRILELASGIPEPALTSDITEIYYRVRYGGHIPTEAELAEMEQLVRTVRKNLLTVHHRFPEA